VHTEPTRSFVSGLAEAVKTALIADASLFEFIETHAELLLNRDLDTVGEVVRRCACIKANVVSIDPYEKGIRASLNFGHTVGHAIESSGHYERFTHGESVALGMVIALRLNSQWNTSTDPDLEQRTIRLLHRLSLPTTVSETMIAEASPFLIHDKKRRGNQVKFIVVPVLGECTVRRIIVNDLARDLKQIFADKTT
jgi:3-dehydroquinate synthetase